MLDDWLEMRSLSDLDLQHVTATLHAVARVHLAADRERVAKMLAPERVPVALGVHGSLSQP